MSDNCEKPFFVGGDGGEALYYIDLNSQKDSVYVYCMETNTSQVHAETWGKYLKDIKSIHNEVDGDQ